MTAPRRKPTEVVTLPGFVAYWVLRGIARQIGVDTRSGALSARMLFRAWMRQKWQQLPRPVRAGLFAVGVTGRTAYRAGRYAGRTVAAGTRHGVAEGRERHREHQELLPLRREFARHDRRRWETGTEEWQRSHDAYFAAADRIRDAQELRRYQHRYGATEGRERFREDRELERIQDEIDDNHEREKAAWRAAGKPRYTPHSEEYLRLHDKYYTALNRIEADRAKRAGEPAPPPKLGPGTTHMGTTPYRYHDYHEDEAGPDPLVTGSAIPLYPGPDDGSPDHAQRLAAWQQWRAQQPGGERRASDRSTTEAGGHPDYDFSGPVLDNEYGDPIHESEVDLAAALAADDAAEERGMHADDRRTCYQCQCWADHAHDPFTNRRISLAEYESRRRRREMSSPGNQNTTNGGTAMTAPTNTPGGDVVSIADLRDVYQRTGPAMAAVQEQQAAAAAGFRDQAAAYEAAVGGLTAEGHDAQTVSEASAAMEAMHIAAQRADDAAVAADAAQAAIGAALQGLERHQALEQAVGSHAGPARSTAAYMPR